MSAPLFGTPAGADGSAETAIASSPRGQTQSLYRKYRPQSFDADELVGQEHVVKTLRNAILLDRVAHAYLFCGPRGTGKTTTARLLAKAVNCLAPDVDDRPCNACANCIAISTNATTDVIEIDAASNRGIDDIRELRERVKYAPSQLKTKFYIIDEAHQITGAAANAFLKTLEEPPPHTKFVLATTDPEELLTTIVSRCQRFDFRRISVDRIVARLRGVATLEGLEADDDALGMIARHATGSLRDALGLLDQLSVYQEDGEEHGSRTVTLDAVRALLGVSRNDRIEGLATALADKDAAAALTIVNDAVDAGEDPRQLNKQLVAYLRSLMYARAGSPGDADAIATQLAARFDLHDLAEYANLFSQVDYRIKHSAYAQLPLEVALVGAITKPAAVQSAAPVATPNAPRSAAREQSSSGYSATGITPEEIAASPPSSRLADRVRGKTSSSEPRQPEQKIAPRVTTTEQAPPTARPIAKEPAKPAERPVTTAASNAAGNNAVTVAALADLWPQIRLDVKAADRKIEALLAAADPYDVVGSEIRLTTLYEFHCQRLNADKERAIVSDVISRIVQQPITIQCYLRGQEPPRTSNAAPPTVTNAAPPPVTGGDSFEPNLADEPEPYDDAPAPGDRFDSSIAEDRITAAMNIFDADRIDR
jgi:DNA polymerase-3 subunit gamma/tau